ncbi:MAG: NIL domain-containing protein [Evtepia gabavorous]
MKVNILGADTRNIEGKAFGTMLLGLPKSPRRSSRRCATSRASQTSP